MPPSLRVEWVEAQARFGWFRHDGRFAYDKAPAAFDISWCGSRHDQDIADSYVDVLQRHDGDRGG
jgi:hypothetical protein